VKVSGLIWQDIKSTKRSKGGIKKVLDIFGSFWLNGNMRDFED